MKNKTSDLVAPAKRPSLQALVRN
ncbi:hypothetical protein Ocin01_15881 [Orchesella cincta]|uniref:Uncharacterized protein n=1 Tax=Orchesella cincta TaxID=48709 RepID=A0A1D2MD07_ORCCI|nr:hypothetical protein Ocin01_15881 [Orchesella cincta]